MWTLEPDTPELRVVLQPAGVADLRDGARLGVEGRRDAVAGKPCGSSGRSRIRVVLFWRFTRVQRRVRVGQGRAGDVVVHDLPAQVGLQAADAGECRSIAQTVLGEDNLEAAA
ncbi:MAG TPA: hypothetical protein VNW94_09210 [Streptosporangiaceae bacterium]|nr:hypothetical protein [Streptosporangiaceae bacterium]